MRVEDHSSTLYFFFAFSPVTNIDFDAWSVASSGNVVNDYYFVYDSYGSPHFNDIAFGYYTHLVGYIDVSINISANSYGYKIYTLSGHRLE